MGMSKIRIEMARSREYPEGSALHGYEFVAPLNSTGQIDADVWHQQRAKCRVRRFWEGEADEIGHLTRKPGGAWVFHYDVHGNINDDETGYRLGNHVFRPGEYVSIREHDEDMNTFKVVSVTSLS
jgi:hypothetical protein